MNDLYQKEIFDEKVMVTLCLGVVFWKKKEENAITRIHWRDVF